MPIYYILLVFMIADLQLVNSKRLSDKFCSLHYQKHVKIAVLESKEEIRINMIHHLPIPLHCCTLFYTYLTL